MLTIENVSDLQVGDIGFTVIPGRVGGLISFGQWLIDLVALLRGRATEGAWFTHAFIVVTTLPGGDAEILEAMPGGARRVRIGGGGRIGPGYGYARLPLSADQRTMVGWKAATMIGLPYSFLDYLSIALLHLGVPRALVARRVTWSGRMICSQLVDDVLTRVGFHLFADGRLPQDVTPGALFRRAGAVGEIVWW